MNSKKQITSKAVIKSSPGKLTIGKAKFKLEEYKPKKKLETGKYIIVFGNNKSVKLLNTSQLLPEVIAGAVNFSGIGRQLIEVFNPQYGSGYDGPGANPSLFPGRFLFMESNNFNTSYFGWYFNKLATYDQELRFNIFMGAYTGLQPEPAINYMVLEIHTYNELDPISLVISVNDAEVNYQFNPIGENKIVFYITKPADTNWVSISIKLKNEGGEPVRNGIWINQVERYKTLFRPFDDLDVLENSV